MWDKETHGLVFSDDSHHGQSHAKHVWVELSDPACRSGNMQLLELARSSSELSHPHPTPPHVESRPRGGVGFKQLKDRLGLTCSIGTFDTNKHERPVRYDLPVPELGDGDTPARR